MPKQTLYIVISLLVATLVSFVYFWPDGKLHIIACDVGQGDAILVTYGFSQLLIDGGPNDRVLGCLARNMPFWDRTIEIIINTHPDKDHLSGLVSVIQRYRLKYLISNSLAVDSKLFSQFHQLVKDEGIEVHSPKAGEKLKIRDLEINFLWPDEQVGNLALWQEPLPEKKSVLGEAVYGEKTNENSIVSLLRYKEFDALFVGDIVVGQEQQVVDHCQYGDCREPLELLKVAHHGSKTSTSKVLLDFFQPKIAIISVGENSWGHPTEEVLERLKSVGSKILQTKQLGDIKITTDGKRISW